MTNSLMPLLAGVGRLAATSLVFTFAYCQQAVCGPSRNSFMVAPTASPKSWDLSGAITFLLQQHPGEFPRPRAAKYYPAPHFLGAVPQ